MDLINETLRKGMCSSIQQSTIQFSMVYINYYYVYVNKDNNIPNVCHVFFVVCPCFAYSSGKQIHIKIVNKVLR